jgi:hypothetical protein
MREFYFASKLSRKYYKALEKLLFFNEKQALFIRDIEKNIEEYGVPRIVADGETLRIKTTLINDVQNLFAFDSEAEDANLIGLILYFRPTLNKMIVLHIAVDENYTFDGKFSDQTLTIQLIDKVREIVLKIKGIELLSIAYGRDFTISIRE